MASPPHLRTDVWGTHLPGVMIGGRLLGVIFMSFRGLPAL